MSAPAVILAVHGWHTECESCGYGKGGPYGAMNPARRGEPILTPESTVCHGCGRTFTHVQDVYSLGAPKPIEPSERAA